MRTYTHARIHPANRTDGRTDTHVQYSAYRVVGEEPRELVQYEPAVLPAVNDIGPLAQRTLHYPLRVLAAVGIRRPGSATGRHTSKDEVRRVADVRIIKTHSIGRVL